MDALIRALGPAPAVAAGGLLGLEHEYRVERAGQVVDFRRLIHHLPVPGARLDPGDTNAYRLGSGLALTCDGEEAEVACPPVAVRPGFTGEIAAWAGCGHSTLAGLLPPGTRLRGYSVHLSAAVADDVADTVAACYARTFAPAVMLLVDRRTSHGIYVRPRPGRLELCGEFTAGARLRAAAALVAGSVRAMAQAVEGRAPVELPELAVAVEPAVGRHGLYIGRNTAFGHDLYAAGRGARLPVVGGGEIGVQAYLERAWAIAARALGGDAGAADLAGGDAVIAGSSPLGVELDDADEAAVGAASAVAASPFGDALRPRTRGAVTVSVEIATWGFTVFRLGRGPGRAFLCVPGTQLGSFLATLDSGALDGMLAAATDHPGPDRTLETWAQTRRPGVWDDVAAPAGLLPPERDPDAGSPPRPSVHPDPRPGKAAPPGKVARPGKPAVAVLVGTPDSAPAGGARPAGPAPPGGSVGRARPRPRGLAVAAIVATILGVAGAAAAILGRPAHQTVTVTTLAALPDTSPAAGPPLTATTSTGALPSTSATPPPPSEVPTSPAVPPSTTTATTAANAATATTTPVTTPPTTSAATTTSPPPTTSTTASTPGVVDIRPGCAFSPGSLTRPVGSTVRFRNQTGEQIAVFVNAPAGGTDTNLLVAAGQQSAAYALSVGGVYFVECTTVGGAGTMQITATIA